MPGWLLVLFVLGALVGIKVWFDALRKLPPVGPADAMACRYQVPDMIFAGFLGLFFLLMITSAGQEAAPVTRQVLLNGMIFYISLVTAILSFLLLRGLSPAEIFGLGRQRIPLRSGPARPSPLIAWFSAEPIEPIERSAGDESTAPRSVEETDLAENAPLPWTRDLGRGLLLFMAAYPILMLVQLGSYTFLHEDAPSQDIVRFLVENADWADRLAVLALALVVAPLAEEFVFRGYLYGVMRQVGGRWCAIATTSLLFSAIHLHMPSLPALFLLGVALCLIYEITRRLWIPFVLHAIFNGISATVALLWPGLVQ